MASCDPCSQFHLMWNKAFVGVLYLGTGWESGLDFRRYLKGFGCLALIDLPSVSEEYDELNIIGQSLPAPPSPFSYSIMDISYFCFVSLNLVLLGCIFFFLWCLTTSSWPFLFLLIPIFHYYLVFLSEPLFSTKEVIIY